MFASLFKQSSNFSKFIFILFSILVGFTLFMFLGFLIAIPLFGVNLNDLTLNLKASNPSNIPILKYLQAVYSIGLFVFPPIMVAYFLNGKIGEYLKTDKVPLLISASIVCLIMVFALPLINYLMLINESIKFPSSLAGFEHELKALENETQELSKSFLKADSLWIYFANLVVMAVIPAIGEELLFRGVFQQLFKDWTKNIHVAIWFTAFLFSAMHMQFYGFIPRMILGALFGYLFYWSGNLWLAILAHFVNNSIAVTAFYVSNNLAEKADTIGAHIEISIELILSILLVSTLIYSFIKIEKEKRIKLQKLEIEMREIDSESKNAE